ncbi:MAG: imidazolonepropionase [Holophagales bacterium]|jgi:imidazolonepropionase|nr:imidazolonepropionase [Holophagales bacterium]
MEKTKLLTNLRGLITPDPSQSWKVDFIEAPVVALKNGHVDWIGGRAELPSEYANSEQIDGKGKWASPGFVDPHTHLIFGGDRSQEFNRRLHGVTYAQIASEGGGIRETVRATRQATVSELVNIGASRLQKMRSKGVLHVECKTGYGLELETESRLLQAYSELLKSGWSLDITIMPAHDIPVEYAGKPDEYIEVVSEEWQPELVRRHPNTASFCDVFVEKGVFTPEHGRRVLESGLRLGLKPRIHADEFVHTGGAELAAEFGAASADHLMFCSDQGMAAMAKAGVVPTLLPATTLFLGMRDFAPARRMIEAGCRVALASDFNPGSCACIDPLLILRLACLQLRMTFEEAFTAMTLHPALSLSRSDLGHLYPGARADLLLWDVKHPLELVYWMGEAYRPEIICASA